MTKSEPYSLRSLDEAALRGIMEDSPEEEYLKDPFYHLLKKQLDPNYEIPPGIRGIRYDNPEENQAETEWQINLPMTPKEQDPNDTEGV